MAIYLAHVNNIMYTSFVFKCEIIYLYRGHSNFVGFSSNQCTHTANTTITV